MNELSTSTNLDDMPIAWVERIFDQMLLTYGKKFTDQWGGADPDKLIKFWCAGLAGYAGSEIKRGLSGLDVREWPPTLPEFKKMCRPSIDPLVAYYEALNGLQERLKGDVGTWSHPAIFHASKGLQFDLLNQTYSQIKTRWENALADQLQKGQWDEITKPVLMIATSTTQASKDEAVKALAKIERQAGVALEHKTDHRLWAKKIIKLSAERDHGLSEIQIRFAKEALKERQDV